MSASEKLRALVLEGEWNEPHLWHYYMAEEESESIALLRSALPLIADVVEAAELIDSLTFPASFAGEIDGVKHYGTSGDAARVIAPALTALREHLDA